MACTSFADQIVCSCWLVPFVKSFLFLVLCFCSFFFYSSLKYRAPPTMPLSNKGTPDVFTIADIERSVPSAERDNSGRGRILLEMGKLSLYMCSFS